MSYKDEKVLISEFDDGRYDYGHEYIERADGSHFLRIWGEGCIQREIEFEDLMTKIVKINAKSEV